MNRPSFGAFSPLGAEGGGFEPPVREPVRQFSKLLVSATHPSFQGHWSLKPWGYLLDCGCKGNAFFRHLQIFSEKFSEKHTFSVYSTIFIILKSEIFPSGLMVAFTLNLLVPFLALSMNSTSWLAEKLTLSS